MSKEIEQIISRLDADTIGDFMDSVEDENEAIASSIATLEKSPRNDEAINIVFRALHTIKGNAKICGLDRLSDLAHAIENIFTEVRSGHIAFIPQLGEIILLSLDEFKFACEDVFQEMEFDEQKISNIIERLEAVHNSELEELSRLTDKITLLFSDQIEGVENTVALRGPELSGMQSGMSLHDELALFKSLAIRLEKKYSYWDGRVERMLPIATGINALVDAPMDKVQLEMALYAHDIGMAFFPDSLVLKEGKFSESERELIDSHISTAANILRCTPSWNEATLAVEQHHERPDRKGKPNGLEGNEIVLGARILALVDAFESMTCLRPDRQFKRSVLRAVTEINNCTGTQFCPELVPIFNTVIRNQIASKKS